jgi:predicted O-methyltransferase YrrM
MRSIVCLFRFVPILLLPPAGIHGGPPVCFERQLSSGRDYYRDLSDPRTIPVLESLGNEPHRNDVSPQEGRYLYDLIVRNGLTSGLVISRSNGYPVIWTGMAFQRTGGRMIAVGESKEQTRIVTANLRKAGLLDRTELREGRNAAELSGLTGPFDFVFLDGVPGDYSVFLTLLLPAIRPGGFIAAHDVNSRSSEAADFIRKITGSAQLKTELLAISPHGMSVTQKLFSRDF